jgi:hypothetical protein
MVTPRELAQASVRHWVDAVPCTHSARPPAFAIADAWAAVAVMWAFWMGFIIFLAEPCQLLAWWPFPTIDRVAWPRQPLLAACINLALVAVFGLQHSIMARPCFKRCVMGWIPEGLWRSSSSSCSGSPFLHDTCWPISLQKSVAVGGEQWLRLRTTLRGGGLR